jgi:hypothetical protein
MKLYEQDTLMKPKNWRRSEILVDAATHSGLGTLVRAKTISRSGIQCMDFRLIINMYNIFLDCTWAKVYTRWSAPFCTWATKLMRHLTEISREIYRWFDIGSTQCMEFNANHEQYNVFIVIRPNKGSRRFNSLLCVRNQIWHSTGIRWEMILRWFLKNPKEDTFRPNMSNTATFYLRVKTAFQKHIL